ncbi:MAG: hypothetical protein KKC42_02855 [Candidatus Omnitrophica bacterium]|nr:hypothetical protein [Candidatus Omnitrophota bacterium]MBU1090766.1 hypothetical protein [Candidatus Omnitrophota bacterium]MBU1906195.1 hypothetical protein [Candidatus Omnitrophota bacterium]
MLVILLILVGILLRFAPHAPNFTPVAAIALFAGAYLSKKHALIIPLVLMIVSDMFLGLHNVVLFTWGGFALVALLGTWLKKHKTFSASVSLSLVSAVLFYLVTNFGVWAMGWYPRNFSGLINCYAMGLPFLRNTLFSTLLYTAVFMGTYELIARFTKETKLAKVLLNK